MSYMDFGPESWDDLFARFFGAGEPRRPVYRVDITRLMSGDAREMLADAARRAARAAAPTWTPTTCSGRRCSASRCGTWSAGPAPTRTPCSNAARRRADGRRRGGGAAEPVAHPGGQAGAARRPPAVPGDGRHLHRPRAHPDGAAAQPGVAGRADAGRRPDPAARRCRPPAPSARPVPGRPDRRHPDPRPVRPGPHRPGPRRRARPGDRPGRRDRAGIEMLSRRTKNNPVLIGEAGVGKTAIVEGSPSGSSTATCRRPCAASGWSSSTWPAWSPAPATAATSRSG